VKGAVEGSAEPPPLETRDPRPLAIAILGTWANPLLHVTFSEDGLATIRMFGGEKNGRWSVDGDGKLRAGLMGHEQSVDAWVAGDRLTIVTEGRALTLTRER
jgi:hypothetical protein